MKKSLVYVALLVLSSSMIYELMAHPTIAQATGDSNITAVENNVVAIETNPVHTQPKMMLAPTVASSANWAHGWTLAQHTTSTDLHNSHLSSITETSTIETSTRSILSTNTAPIVLASASTPSITDPSSSTNGNKNSTINANEKSNIATNNDAGSKVKVNDQVALGDIASYHFPNQHDMSFVGPEATQQLLDKEDTGDLITGQIVGSLLDRQDNAWVILMYTEDGHIFDYDHQQIDAQRMLETYQQASQQQNEHRSDSSKLHVLGWGKEPSYKVASHTLTWYLKLKKSAGDDVVNDEARILTRTGYISAIMVTDEQRFKQDDATFEHDVLPNIDINSGSTYSDYHSDTDKDSKLTLEGLILTGAGTQSAKTYGTFLIVNKLWFIVVPIIGLFYWNHRNRSRREQEHAKELEAILYADHQINELPMRRRPAPPVDQTDSDQK
ncbi:DUF2167 domain-containing protein [Paenibacillus wenxiniae]|uniref:DUF2167 domain-containing protein n=1 Tax=Paenibacillus wenxiniae TaxID=1636843 RepID=A0ABW4RFS4_9BACL